MTYAMARLLPATSTGAVQDFITTASIDVFANGVENNMFTPQAVASGVDTIQQLDEISGHNSVINGLIARQNVSEHDGDVRPDAFSVADPSEMNALGFLTEVGIANFAQAVKAGILSEKGAELAMGIIGRVIEDGDYDDSIDLSPLRDKTMDVAAARRHLVSTFTDNSAVLDAAVLVGTFGDLLRTRAYNPDNLIPRATELLEQLPDNNKLLSLLGRVYSDKGDRLLRGGEVDEAKQIYSQAIGYYEKLIQLTSQNWQARNNIAIMYFSLSRSDPSSLERSLQYFEAALDDLEAAGLHEKNPKLSYVYDNIGHAYIRANKFDDAQRILNRSMTINHDFRATPMKWLAMALIKKAYLSERMDRTEKLQEYSRAFRLMREAKEIFAQTQMTPGFLNHALDGLLNDVVADIALDQVRTLFSSLGPRDDITQGMISDIVNAIDILVIFSQNPLHYSD